MSVIVMTKFAGKASDLERIAADEHAQTLRRMKDVGESQGCLHHCFVEDTDGNVLVIDEWESEDAFNAFFAAQAPDISKMAADAGVTTPPASTAYRILDTPDRF